MLFEDTFVNRAIASMPVFVEERTFDNNFVLDDEYDLWRYQFLESETWWPDLTVDQVDQIIQISGSYGEEIGIGMPYNIRGILRFYGWYLERELRERLNADFSYYMAMKQLSLELN